MTPYHRLLIHREFKLIMVSAWHEQYGNGLLRHLDGHPQCAAYPFESLLGCPDSSNLIAGPLGPVPQRYAYSRFPTDITSEQAYHLIQDGELKTYLRTPQVSKFASCGLQMSEATRIEAFKQCLDGWSRPETPQAMARSGMGGLFISGHVPKTRAGYVQAFFESTFAAWTNYARTGRETHYVGYSPPILADADAFFSDFPLGHMVHIIRNPFSGYADHKRRPFPMSLTRYCQVWSVCCLLAAIYLGKHAGRFHTVCYEDLVRDRRDTLNRLTRDLGLEPFPAGDLSPSFNRQPLAQVFPWGTIRTPTTEANLATARELTQKEKTAIEVECGPILRHWYGGAEIAGFTS